MAKYYGSPWGVIVGKIGPVVGKRSKGQNTICRCGKRVVKGSIKFYEEVVKGKEDLDKINVRLWNMLRIRATIGVIGKNSMDSVIRPVWDKLAKQRKLLMSGFNLFAKYNIGPLYYSLPNRYAFIGPDNMPDMRVFRFTEGNLEPGTIEKAVYNDGKLEVEWSSFYYKDAQKSDKVHIFVIYWKLPHLQNGLPHPRPYYTLRLWGSAKEAVGIRGDYKAVIELEKKLDYNYLTVYLGFSSQKFGYSTSTASSVLGP